LLTSLHGGEPPEVSHYGLDVVEAAEHPVDLEASLHLQGLAPVVDQQAV